MFQVAELLAAAGIGDGFEGFPQEFDDETLLPWAREVDDFLCVWTDVTDPDTPSLNARHYEVDLRAIPGTFDVAVRLEYGFGPSDEESGVLFEVTFSTRPPAPAEDSAFQHEASGEIARRVLAALAEHEEPYVAECQRRMGGAL
jgi:hypothetical protein